MNTRSSRRKSADEWWHRYQVHGVLKAGKRRHLQLVKFKISKLEADNYNFRAMLSFTFDRGVRPGDFIKLVDFKEKELWMSDTPAEIGDLLPLFSAVKLRTNGKGPTVLMHGLGLGVALQGCFLNGASHVTVVERDKTCIELVGRQWRKIYGDALTLIHGDALTMDWPRGSHWDLVWHDIWPQITVENNDTMSRLHRRFGGRCDWQDSWCRERVKSMVREDRRVTYL